MKIGKKILIALLAAITMVSGVYAQQWHTTLDVRRPATMTLPVNVEDLLIVNNAPQQPEDLGHSLLVDGSDCGSQSIDLSQAATRVVFAAAEVLDYSYMFYSVGLVADTQNKGSFFTNNVLTTAQAETLCENYSTDALLALNKIIIYDIQESFLNEDGEYYAYLEVFVNTLWTLYYHSGGVMKNTSFTHADTLYWDGTDYDRAHAVQILPDRQTALLDVATFAGETVAEKLIPHWETVDRYLYENDNRLVAEGMQHFTYRRWEKAIDSWKEAYQESGDTKKSKDNEVRAYAAANIAVTEEILGDLQAAEQWAKRSVEAFAKIKTAEAAQQQVNMTYYLRELVQREKDEKKLNVNK